MHINKTVKKFQQLSHLQIKTLSLTVFLVKEYIYLIQIYIDYQISTKTSFL